MNLLELIHEIFSKQDMIYAVLSSPRVKSVKIAHKLTFRPLEIKGVLHYQLSSFVGAQVLHRNLTSEECQKEVFTQLQEHFKQGVIYTEEADYHVLVNKKHECTILKKAATKSKLGLKLSHDRKKKYLLEEGTKVPFLIALGVMSPEGKVHAKKSDKFRQINRFLEMIDDVLPSLDKSRVLRIIDFGCGKAYLTFALYHYLEEKGFRFEIRGLDLKEEVVKHCQELADRLDYKQLKFLVGDIKDYQMDKKVDLVVTLHACDTATDAAIYKAILWEAQVILTVPCCQHELFKQIENPLLKPLLKHGILKERFSALVTDAARAQLLELQGYETQILEFIDLEHTPKNLLIRAVRRSSKKVSAQAKEEYLNFTRTLHVKPYLEKLLE